MKDILLNVFVFVDDFCKVFRPHWEALLIESKGENSRYRKFDLSLSEIMTIQLCFHLGGFKTFKSYYRFLEKYHKKEFPNLISYNRFVEIKSSSVIPFCIFFQIVCASCDGESYVDSTALPICHIKREYSFKLFKGIAKKSRSTMGWFIGFKLHMIVNQYGHPISFEVTHANCDDRKAPDGLFSKIFGKIFGDRGYVGQPFFTRMKEKTIRIITALRNNMKPQIMTKIDSLKLNKRGIIESVFNCLKNHLNMQHTRHRSQHNYAMNLITAICSYCLRYITNLFIINKAPLMVH